MKGFKKLTVMCLMRIAEDVLFQMDSKTVILMYILQ